jgi:very-short-patch-repair endonuclease
MIQTLDKGWNKKAPPLQGRGLGWGLSIERIAALQALAARMRRNPTEPEKRLWRALSNSQLEGFKFRRQAVIGGYIADFLCPRRAFVVEVDGDTHDAAKDRLRDDELAGFGYTVFRVTNHDVMFNIDGVAQAIVSAISAQPARWDSPHPNPTPVREGVER